MQGAHIAQLRYYEHSDPHRIAVAIIGSLLRGVPWEQYHAKLWPVRMDHVTGPISIRVQCVGPVSVDSQYDQNKLTLRCGSHLMRGVTGLDQLLQQRVWLHGIAEQVRGHYLGYDEAISPDLITLGVTTGEVPGRANLYLTMTRLGDFLAREHGIDGSTYAMHLIAGPAVYRYEQPAGGPAPWPVITEVPSKISEVVHITPQRHSSPIWTRKHDWKGRRPSVGQFHSCSLTGAGTGRIWHILLDSCLGVAAARPFVLRV